MRRRTGPGSIRGLSIHRVASVSILALAAGCAPQEAPKDEVHSGTAVISSAGDELGYVDLASSCTDEAQAQLELGLALLHHMNYVKAEPVFRAAAETDPECALAYWGAAMTYVHPLWPDTISAERRAEGEELLSRAAEAAHAGPREAGYVAALAGYYADPERGERVRLASFLEGWRSVHTNHPDDIEAAVFYALALLANAPAEDKSYEKADRSGRTPRRGPRPDPPTPRRAPLHDPRLRLSTARRARPRHRPPLRRPGAGEHARAPHDEPHLHPLGSMARVDRVQRSRRRGRGRTHGEG